MFRALLIPNCVVGLLALAIARWVYNIIYQSKAFEEVDSPLNQQYNTLVIVATSREYIEMSWWTPCSENIYKRRHISN